MWRIALLYVGALVGAGFASGRELVTFFVAFGSRGFWGIALVTALLAVSGVLLLWLCRSLDCDHYQQLFAILFGARWGHLAAAVLSLALWLGLAVMLGGCGTLAEELLMVPKTAGFVLAAFLVAWPLSRGGEGFLKLNGYLMPLLMALAIFCALGFLRQPLACWQAVAGPVLLPNWIMAATLYWLYNMLLALAVLVGVSRYRRAGGAVVLGALILGALALLLSLCLARLSMGQRAAQMPMLSMAQMMGRGYGLLYAWVMLLALYTTALANCYGLVANYSDRFTNRKILLAVILLPTALLLPFDFAGLVATVYPLLGYAGLPILLGMILRAVLMKLGGKI